MTNSLTGMKKAIVLAVAVATVVATAGLTAFAPSQVSAASYGDLIMGETLSTVYYYGSDGQRYSFPNENTFFSWYGDFDGVVQITDEELADITLAGNIVYRPGSRWIKIESDEKVYATSTDGSIHWVESEEVAEGLAGEDWNTFIDDVPDVFFVDYTVGDSLSDASAGYNGMLWTDGTDTYLVWDGELRMISDLADNGFMEGFVLAGTGFDSSSLTAGDDVDSELSYLTDTAQMVETDTYADTEEVTVAVADASPASSTLVAGQGIAHMASYEFTNPTDEDVVITSLALTRTGVSADSTLSSTYLFDGWMRLTDSATISSGVMTWNDTSGLFTIPAGGDYTVDVRSNIATSTSGQTVGLELADADAVGFSGSYEADGSFPLEGENHTIATVSTFATATFAGTVLPSSDGAPDPQDDFRVWEKAVTVGNNEVYLHAMSLRNIGSIDDTDVENWRFYVSGVEYATADVQDANGYVTFDLSDDPLLMNTASHTVKVLADLVGGSTRTVQVNLRKAADVIMIDADYDQPLLVTLPTTDAVAQTIASGTLSITKASDSPAGEVTEGSSNVVLGKWDVSANGEAIKVETMRFAVVDGIGGDVIEMRNGAVYLDDAQIGSTTDLNSTAASPAYTEYSFGSSMVVYPGSDVVLEVRADIYDNDGADGIADSDTLTARIVDMNGTNNAERMTSGGYIDAPDGAAVTANALTVAAGTLTRAKNNAYANQTAVDPKYDYKIGSWTVSASTAEDYSLTNFDVDFSGSTSVTAASDLANLYLMYGPEDDLTATSTKATVSATSNSWSVDYTLEAGETIYVHAYSDLKSSLTTSSRVVADIDVDGLRSETGSTDDGSDVAGQTITIATGTFVVGVDGTSAVAGVYAGDQTIDAGYVRFTSTNEDYYIDDVTVQIAAAAVGVATGVSFYDGETLVGSEVFDENFGRNATFNNLNYLVSANSYDLLTVKLDLSQIGTGYGATGQDVAVTLVTVDYKNGEGVAQLPQISSFTDAATNEMNVFKSFPVVTHSDLTNSTIVNGQAQDLYKFTVTADSSGDIAIKQMKFPVTFTDGGETTDSLVLDTWKLYKNGTDISSTVTITDSDDTSDDLKSTTDLLNETDTGDSVIVIWATTEEVIAAGETVTYTLRATPSIFDANGTTGDEDYFSIYLAGDVDNATDVCLSTLNAPLWELDAIESGVCAATESGNTGYNFIWSDNSGSSHSATSETGAADWAGGYLILNLDLAGETWAK